MNGALSSNQFSKRPVVQKFGQALDTYETSKALRHMGMTAAVRYAIGAPPTYRHLQDLLTGNNLRRGAGMFGGNNGNTPDSVPQANTTPVEGNFNTGEA